MKTLIVYEKNTGNVTFTQSINDSEDVEYDYIIADVPENRIVARVDNGEIILEDTPEVKEIKERLNQIKIEEQEIKKKLLLIENGIKIKWTHRMWHNGFQRKNNNIADKSFNNKYYKYISSVCYIYI